MNKINKSAFYLISNIFFISALFLFSANFITAAISDDLILYANNPDIEELNEKIDESNEKIENLKKATKEYEEKIKEYEGKGATLKNQLALLDNQIIKLELDVKTNQLKIDKTKLEIASMENQIAKEEEEIMNKKEDLIEYLRIINKTDQKSYLEILILNESLAEFFNELNYTEELQNDIKKSVDRLKILKEAIELQKANKENQQTELENLKLALEAQEDKLKGEQRAKEILLIETKSSEIQFEKLLVESKQRQGEISSNILDIQEKIKQKIINIKSGSDNPKDTLLIWPISGSHYITAYFHDPDYPFRYVFEHPAIDVRAAQGTPISSPSPGYVARVNDAGYGYSYIILIHDNDISTVYGHVSAIYVKENTYVNTGDIIGLTGGAPGTLGAGNLSTGPHLHFEVRLNGIPVNPLEYLP